MPQKIDKIITYTHEKPHVKQIKIHHILIINQSNFPTLYRNILPIPTHKNNAILHKFLYKNTSIKLYKYTIFLHKIAHILT